MKMQNADMEFVTFDAQDVIATSGEFSLNANSTYQLKGFEDGEKYNAFIEETLKDGQTTYSWYIFKNGTSEHSDYPVGLNSATHFELKNGSTGLTVNGLYRKDNEDPTSALSKYKTVYQWLGGNFVEQ